MCLTIRSICKDFEIVVAANSFFEEMLIKGSQLVRYMTNKRVLCAVLFVTCMTTLIVETRTTSSSKK